VLINSLANGIKTDKDIDNALQSFREQIQMDRDQSTALVLNKELKQMSDFLKQKLQERRLSSPVMHSFKIPRFDPTKRMGRRPSSGEEQIDLKYGK
jgi:hypothetical protein